MDSLFLSVCLFFKLAEHKGLSTGWFKCTFLEWNFAHSQNRTFTMIVYAIINYMRALYYDVLVLFYFAKPQMLPDSPFTMLSHHRVKLDIPFKSFHSLYFSLGEKKFFVPLAICLKTIFSWIILSENTPSFYHFFKMAILASSLKTRWNKRCLTAD